MKKVRSFAIRATWFIALAEFLVVIPLLGLTMLVLSLPMLAITAI